MAMTALELYATLRRAGARFECTPGGVDVICPVELVKQYQADLLRSVRDFAAVVAEFDAPESPISNRIIYGVIHYLQGRGDHGSTDSR